MFSIRVNQQIPLREIEIYEQEVELTKELQAKGHGRHCSYRLVWGDGECMCHKSLDDER
jgi:hypothetical protein